MPREFKGSGIPTDELEGFTGEIVEVGGESNLEVGDRIEFEEDGVKHRGVIEEKYSGRSDPKISGFSVRLDVPLVKPDSYVLRKTILNNGKIRKIS